MLQEFFCEHDEKIMDCLNGYSGLFQAVIALATLYVAWRSFLLSKRSIEHSDMALEHSEKVFLQQAKHDKLSVRPKLELDIEDSQTNSGYLKIQLANRGLGPAIVTGVDFEVEAGDQIIMKYDSFGVFEKEASVDLLEDSNEIPVGGGISASEKVFLFYIDEQDGSRVQMSIKYRDLYEVDQEPEIKKLK